MDTIGPGSTSPSWGNLNNSKRTSWHSLVEQIMLLSLFTTLCVYTHSENWFPALFNYIKCMNTLPPLKLAQRSPNVAGLTPLDNLVVIRFMRSRRQSAHTQHFVFCWHGSRRILMSSLQFTVCDRNLDDSDGHGDALPCSLLIAVSY